MDSTEQEQIVELSIAIVRVDGLVQDVWIIKDQTEQLNDKED